MITLPSWAKDGVISHVHVHLSIGDALRLLVSRRMVVSVETACEIAPGRVETLTSSASVVPIWTPKRGYVEVAEEKPRSAEGRP